jgi:hypothetical protein
MPTVTVVGVVPLPMPRDGVAPAFCSRSTARRNSDGTLTVRSAYIYPHNLSRSVEERNDD